MKIAIMQPYFFPYIGYWQLLNAVDVFVIYDDVNFIKQGYINRNTILSKNERLRVTLEVIGASSNKIIKEVEVGCNANKILKTLTQSYCKSPFFDSSYSLIEKILKNKEKNLAKFLGFAIQEVSEFIGIKTQFLYSSDIKKSKDSFGEEKIIEICKNLYATNYINAVGGQKLYNQEVFQKENIKLNFIKTEITKYKQFNNEYIPNLSIIDIIMFNNKKAIKEMLNEYELI